MKHPNHIFNGKAHERKQIMYLNNEYFLSTFIYFSFCLLNLLNISFYLLFKSLILISFVLFLSI